MQNTYHALITHTQLPNTHAHLLAVLLKEGTG